MHEAVPMTGFSRLVISGTYRSGTTLLQKMLDSRADCEVVMQPSLPLFRGLRRAIAESVGAIDGSEGPMGVEFAPTADVAGTALYGVAVGNQQIDSIIRDTHATLAPLWQAEDQDVPSLVLVNALRAALQPGSAADIALQFFDALAQYRGGQNPAWVGFKDMYIEEVLDPLLAVDPELRVIHIVRDPRAVLASRNYGAYGGNRRGPNLHPLLFVSRMWRTSVRWRHRMATNYSDRVLTLRYEDVARSLTATARELCLFLGISFDDAMATTDGYRTESGAVWRGNSSYGGAPSSDEPRWKRLVPADSVAALEFLCRGEMELEGYVPVWDSERQKDALLGYTEAEETLLPWTRNAGLVLDDAAKQQEIARAGASWNAGS